MQNLNKNTAIKLLFGWLIILFQSYTTFAQSSNNKASSSRPNIVLFISDDHGYEDTGCYGNKIVRTPVVDRLASEGMRFLNSFANTPTCVPSRSVLFSGLLPARNGAHPNHSKVRSGLKTMPHYLKDLGYRVILAGKTHIEPLSAFPFEYVAAYDNPEKKSFVEVLHDLNQKSLDSLINALGKEQNKQPFCLVVGSYAPHVKWPEVKGYDPEKVIVPPYLVNTPATRHAMAQYYTEITSDLEETLGSCLSSLKNNKLEENTLFIYTSDQGPQFPFAKWNLYDAGIRTPYIARWPGKIKAGTTSQALISHVDMMPTFIELAGGKANGDIDGKSYLQVLLGKTYSHHQAVFATHTADTKYGNFNYYPMRSMRTATYKYILNLTPKETYTTHITKALDGSPWPSWLEQAKTDDKAAQLVQRYQHRPAEELYDINKDPYELNNIAANSENMEMLQSLRNQVIEWMDKQNDQEGLTLYYANVKFNNK